MSDGGEKTLKIHIELDGNFKTDFVHFAKLMEVLKDFKAVTTG